MSSAYVGGKSTENALRKQLLQTKAEEQPKLKPSFDPKPTGGAFFSAGSGRTLRARRSQLPPTKIHPELDPHILDRFEALKRSTDKGTPGGNTNLGLDAETLKRFEALKRPTNKGTRESANPGPSPQTALRSVKSSVLTLMESLPSVPGKRAKLDAALTRYDEASRLSGGKALDAFKELHRDLIKGNLQPASPPNRKVEENRQPANGKLEPASPPNPKTGENLQPIKRAIITYMGTLPKEEFDAARAQFQRLHNKHGSKPNDAKALDDYQKLHADLVNGKYKPELPQPRTARWARAEERRLQDIIHKPLDYDDDYEKGTREKEEAKADLENLKLLQEVFGWKV